MLKRIYQVYKYQVRQKQMGSFLYFKVCKACSLNLKNYTFILNKCKHYNIKT